MTEGFAVYPSLRERVVLVTGGASGIGAEEVTQFARQGAKVAFLDIADEAAARNSSRRSSGKTWRRRCICRATCAIFLRCRRPSGKSAGGLARSRCWSTMRPTTSGTTTRMLL